jgi:hypothetical protein
MPPIRPADLDAVGHPSTERSWGLLTQDASPTAIAEAAGCRRAGLLPRIWSLIVASLIALLVAGDSLTAKARWATISWVIRTDPGRAIAGLALGRRNYETGAWKMHADLADGGIAASEDDLVDV